MQHEAVVTATSLDVSSRSAAERLGRCKAFSLRGVLGGVQGPEVVTVTDHVRTTLPKC